jgi:hypothetical protein
VLATQQAGNSGWQGFELGSDFKIFRFKYEVPSLPTGYSVPPIVVLHSDETGAGQAIELIGIYVKPLSRNS